MSLSQAKLERSKIWKYLKYFFKFLKYMVYALINYPDDEFNISKITGKSVEFIGECEKIIYDDKIAYFY